MSEVILVHFGPSVSRSRLPVTPSAIDLVHVPQLKISPTDSSISNHSISSKFSWWLVLPKEYKKGALRAPSSATGGSETSQRPSRFDVGDPD